MKKKRILIFEKRVNRKPLSVRITSKPSRRDFLLGYFSIFLRIRWDISFRNLSGPASWRAYTSTRLARVNQKWQHNKNL